MHQILVVDDDEDIRTVLRAILEDAGYGVLEAGNGREALAVALANRPGAILLDLHLPPTDGFQVLQQISAEPSLRWVPVIIVTGSISDTDLRTARRLHAWDYITKPWAMGEVEARVRLALQATGSTNGASPATVEAPRAQQQVAAGSRRLRPGTRTNAARSNAA